MWKIKHWRWHWQGKANLFNLNNKNLNDLLHTLFFIYSKSVAELKTRFPTLQESVKSLLANEMDYMMTEERFLKEEPERLEIALRRCKKLTGTLVTLKRLVIQQFYTV